MLRKTRMICLWVATKVMRLSRFRCVRFCNKNNKTTKMTSLKFAVGAQVVIKSATRPYLVGATGVIVTAGPSLMKYPYQVAVVPAGGPVQVCSYDESSLAPLSGESPPARRLFQVGDTVRFIGCPGAEIRKKWSDRIALPRGAQLFHTKKDIFGATVEVL